MALAGIRAPLRALEVLGGTFLATWGHLVCSWGSAELILEALGAPFGLTWGALGSFWDAFEAPLGSFLLLCESLFDALGIILVALLRKVRCSKNLCFPCVFKLIFEDLGAWVILF